MVGGGWTWPGVWREEGVGKFLSLPLCRSGVEVRVAWEC